LQRASYLRVPRRVPNNLAEPTQTCHETHSSTYRSCHANQRQHAYPQVITPAGTGSSPFLDGKAGSCQTSRYGASGSLRGRRLRALHRARLSRSGT
jgi:hypothetical protein